MALFRSCLSLLVVLVSLPGTVANDRPIIGVLTQPLGLEALEAVSVHDAYNQTYIAASYVKFIESAGARAVPVHFDAPEEDLRRVFDQLNGLLMPGGGSDIYSHAPLRRAGELFFQLALNASDHGDPFPIHGTCLGFELLGLIVAKDDSVMCKGCFDTFGTPLPLDFSSAAANSKLFGHLPSELKDALSSKKITENSHKSGFKPEVFTSNEALGNFFNVLSTNLDGQGVPFVSTIEAKRYPISATQWHPEKNNYEWGTMLGLHSIPHSAEAVAVSQYIANDFVARARLSEHRFVSEAAEQAALIYNYQTGPDPQGYFSQIYTWEKGYGGLSQRTPDAASVMV